jgi:hypothetical protein
MGSKLSAVNRYLRDPIVRKRTVFTSVSSSSAIEGIRAPFKRLKAQVSTAESGKSPSKTSPLPVKS